jgi:hypothetical protein
MGDFEISVAAWRDEPFPHGNDTSEALDELHADLVLAETWVAETVPPYVTRGEDQPAQVDIASGCASSRRARTSCEVPAALRIGGSRTPIAITQCSFSAPTRIS